MSSGTSRRGKGRSGNQKKQGSPPLPLARELFPELNATFYTADPAAFLHLRIEMLSLMALSMADLAPVLAKHRRIGAVEFNPTGPPDDDQRQRYLVAEAQIVFHHAAEMILRMFFAHVEAPDCPWLGMASSTSFVEFKHKVEATLKAGFDEADIANVFLGGSDPIDAAIRVTDGEFADSVKAVRLLLGFCADRLLTESFLYNAAKHGLTTVQLDESTKLSWGAKDKDRITIHTGPMLAYLHKPAAPNAPKEGPKWHISTTGPLPDQDLAVSTLVYRALRSLWSVAKRRYTAESGELILFTHQDVETCIYGPIASSMNVVRTAVMELQKKKPDGSLTSIGIEFRGPQIPESWSTRDVSNSPAKTVNLPVRQRDRRFSYDSSRALLPFSPKGSSRV
ncbi:hypothetical protein [Williamsia sp. CHRR-6]|uniref:hypothetical protein n=1 Tax=Williamsia sp. CHRR-6 TaxID=2835871 RepID=UPI001BDAE528|nr:hypothetical protein [Williamsia sp. CHRR-6]MBT0566072.1 hypothetical protein [Williamsia sp. CHRR-6]